MSINDLLGDHHAPVQNLRPTTGKTVLMVVGSLCAIAAVVGSWVVPIMRAVDKSGDMTEMVRAVQQIELSVAVMKKDIEHHTEALKDLKEAVKERNVEPVRKR